MVIIREMILLVYMIQCLFRPVKLYTKMERKKNENKSLIKLNSVTVLRWHIKM